jgi:hypothetical protein
MMLFLSSLPAVRRGEALQNVVIGSNITKALKHLRK